MGHHFGSEVLHRQSDVVGGDGEEALQLRIAAQVGPVGLQEGPECPVAHVLHDQDVRFYTHTHTQTMVDSHVHGTATGHTCSPLTLAGVPVQ